VLHTTAIVYTGVVYLHRFVRISGDSPMLKMIKKRWNRISPHGQSLVELAIFFPIIMLMLSGLIEFGFLLNYYLNLMDGPREGARFGVDVSPFSGTGDDNSLSFYESVSQQAINAIVPYELNPVTDDIVISVVAIKDGSIFHRYPKADISKGITNEGEFSWNAYQKAVINPSGSYPFFARSKLSDADINSKLIGSAPKTGAVVVELFYSYKQQLALPWITMVVPDPIPLHMYAVSPLPAATPPDPTPTP
jgi:hypothetical protein